MTPRPLTLSAAYRDYVRGLRELHALIARGEDESEAGEANRDASDAPWAAMTTAERKRASGLSADLYTLSEAGNEPEPRNPQANSQLVEVIEAKQRGEWDRALALLRRWAKYVDLATVSRIRGGIWQQAGDLETAVLFFEHASRLQPDSGAYAAFHLLTLAHIDPTAAVRAATAIVADSQRRQPATVVAACLVLQRTATEETIPKLILAVQEAIGRLDGQDDLARDQVAHRAAFALLGSLHVSAGRLSEGIATFDSGIAAYPDDATLHVCRGMAAGLCGQVGVTDLQQAAALDPTQLWPDYLLARHYLASDDANRCRQHCERALNKSGPDVVKAELSQWLGIARLALGYPESAVYEAFKLAVELCPNDERAAENLFRCERYLKTQQRPDWLTRSEEEVRATSQQLLPLSLAA